MATRPPRRARPRDIAIQLAGLLALSHLLFAAVGLMPGYAESRIARQLAEAALWPTGLRSTQLLTGALIGPVLEELLFRGLAFEAIRRRCGPLAAIAGSALLFGAAHLDAHQAAVATLLGLQLAALREVHGLPLAIGAHVANNALALGLTSLGPIPALSSGVTTVLAGILAGIACASLVQSLRSAETAVPELPTGLQTAADPSE